ncbi:hypothetical protein Zmor_010293 [Zophobas morio]|uniref:Zinc finger PHD-type domain-containing protein n=1 Tax=Zophobas morio TaxID=2755281 RepID=A0AA38IKF6_9CUCU|nr:hypothetical protein Zmor_010293 [Zophobas morio]
MPGTCKACDGDINRRNEKVFSCFLCSNKSHAKCLKIEDAEFKILQKLNNFKYICDECLILQNSEKVDSLKASIDKCLTAIENQNQTINSHGTIINDLLQKMPSSFQKDHVPSYASVTNKSTVIVQPKNTEKKVSETKAELLGKVNPVENNLNISNVKSSRSGGVIISCNSSKDTKKIVEIVENELREDYNIKQLSNLCPRIRISGIPKEITSEMFSKSLVHQNQLLFNDVNEDYKVVSYSSQRKSDKYLQAVVQIDTVSYNNIMKAGKLLIGYKYCKVWDAIDVRRCYNCCGFHHHSDKCDQNFPICPRCSEKHKVQECKSDILKCTNCSMLKATNANINTNHAAWDINKCTVYKSHVENFKKIIFNSQ